MPQGSDEALHTTNARLRAENDRLRARLDALESVGEGSLTDLYSLDPALALDHLGHGIIIHRASDTAVMYANPAAMELLGLSATQLLNRTLPDLHYDVFSADGDPIPVAELPASLALRTRDAVEGITLKLVTTAGRALWVEMSARYVDDIRATEPVVVVSLFNIEERRSLAEVEADLTVARAMGRMGLISWQPEQPEALIWSAEIYHLLEYTPGVIEPSRAHLLARVHEADRPALCALLNADAEVDQAECRVLIEDQLRFLRFKRDPQRPTRLQCQDVTQAREMEISLERSEALLREAGALARLGGWELSPSTGVFTWTEEVYTIHGLLPGRETRLEDAFSFYPKDARRRLLASLSRCQDHGARFDLVLPFKRGSGSERWVRLIGKPVFQGGEVARIRGVIQDVTESRQAEEARRHLEGRMQALAKVESIEVMAAGMAHDFKNHLTTSQLTAQAALLELPEDHPARQPIEALIAHSKEALSLPRQLMVVAGQSQMSMEALDLREMLSNMGRLLEASARGRAHLQIHLPDAPMPIMGDSQQIHQIVINLVLNAAEAMGHSRRGGITIRLWRERRTLSDLAQIRMDRTLPEGEYVHLLVSDEAQGMSEEVQARMFDPFYTTKGSGNGLGLASVMSTVRQHRGFITVSSVLNKGTDITVGLPLMEAAMECGSGEA